MTLSLPDGFVGLGAFAGVMLFVIVLLWLENKSEQGRIKKVQDGDGFMIERDFSRTR